MNQKEVIRNLKKCPHFESCSQNFCQLDLELNLRSGNKSDKCRYMREAKMTKIGEREFISGGRAMADAPLNFVPESNLQRLNRASFERWHEINKKRNQVYGKN